MITFPGPVSALVTLPVAPDRDGIARVLGLERLARGALPDLRATIPAFNRLLVEGAPDSWDPEEIESALAAAAERCLAEEPRGERGRLGLAAGRTGVYPAAGPGGWRLIGRVPAALFADAAERIARFRPGGTVEFRPVDRDEYEAAGG